jgi:FkbM family methyltransferase
MEKSFLEVTQENDFSWGKTDWEFQGIITGEFHTQRVYDWFYQVQPGDIVVDIGASVGPFSMMSLERGAEEVYAVEPSSNSLKTVLFNCGKYLFNKINSPLIPLNYAIGDASQTESIRDVIHFRPDEFSLISFKQLIEDYNISYIDFLKIDCEGGEYSIFIEENIDFLKNNVKHIAAEVHLTYPGNREKFIEFRDNILPYFPKWEARSDPGNPEGMFYDLKQNLYSNEFIYSYERQFMLYIGEHCVMS